MFQGLSRCVRRSWVVVMLLGVCVFALSSCVELVGQRILISYDKAADRLDIIVFYDGVHESEGDEADPKSIESLQKFVSDGEVMFLDWPFHIRPVEWKRFEERDDDSEATDDTRNVTAAEKASLQISRTMRVRAIGHHRDVTGRITGVQWISIEEWSKALEAINAAISEEVIDKATEESVANEWKASVRRIKSAATKGHAWISMDGHALVVRCPVDPLEWRAAQREFFARHLPEIIKTEATSSLRSETQGICELLATLMGSTDVTYSVDDGMVTVTIGSKIRPTPMAFQVRDAAEYNTLLEKEVVRLAPDDVMDQAARLHVGLLPGKVSPAIQIIERFGDHEALMLAVVQLAMKDKASRERAVERLVAYGETWNATGRQPEMPRVSPKESASIEEWLKLWVEPLEKIAHDRDWTVRPIKEPIDQPERTEHGEAQTQPRADHEENAPQAFED